MADFPDEIPAVPPAGAADKRTELERMLEAINTHKSRPAVMSATLIPQYNHISAGPWILNYALHGGIAEGLAVELYGAESSGKSTTAARMAANMQAKHPEKQVLWVDAEGTFDPLWVARHGVDINRLQVHRPESGEEAVNVIIGMMAVWEICGVVIDSVPALVPQKIVDVEAEKDTIGLHPRLIGKLCSKILMSWARERDRNHFVTVVFINQWRTKITMFGDPRSLPGGKQLQYLVTTKIELKNEEVMGKDKFDIDVVDHNEHTFIIGKSKIGNCIKSGKFPMIVNPDHADLTVGAFDEYNTVCTFAKKFGYITGGGSSWRIRDVDEKFKGLADMRRFLIAEDGEYLRLCQRLIAQNRFDKGLQPIPQDGFLLDWNARENINPDDFVTTVKEEAPPPPPPPKRNVTVVAPASPFNPEPPVQHVAQVAQ